MCKEWQLDRTRVTEGVQRCAQGAGVPQHHQSVELMKMTDAAERIIKLVVLCGMCVPDPLSNGSMRIASASRRVWLCRISAWTQITELETPNPIGWCVSVAASGTNCDAAQHWDDLT